MVRYFQTHVRLLARFGSRVMVLAAIATPGWSTDWIVDDDAGPGVDFQDIQPAITAASPGDTILIREGNYSKLKAHKSLTIAREGKGTVRVRGNSLVSNLDPGSDVLISGLTFVTGQSNGVCLQILNNQGSVWFADCWVWGNDSEDIFFAGDEAMSCKNSQDLGLIRCTLRGGAGADYGALPEGSEGLFDAGDGGTALGVESSSVQTFDCVLQGGNGGSDWGGYGNDGYGGGAVIASLSSHVYASRTQLNRGSGLGLNVIWFTSGSVFRHFESLFDGYPVQNYPSADSTTFCFGLHATCPCSNNGFSGAGCGNSFGTDGGRLSLSGSASVSFDTVSLRHTGLAVGTPLLYFQGTLDVGNGQGNPLGDGLLCAGGSVIRLGTRISNGAEDTFGFAVGSDPLLSIRGQIPASGATRYYQVWYRDPNTSCAAGSFNLSNGQLVVWEP